MMKTAQTLFIEVEKCQKKIPELMEIVDTKITSTTDHLSSSLHGVLSENISLKKTHFLRLQIITHTLNSIPDTMDGPLLQIKLCTSLNINVMDLADDLGKMFTQVTTNLETILGRLPVPPSTSEGTPGGRKAVQINETDDMKIDTSADPLTSQTPKETTKESPTKVPTPHSSPTKIQTPIVEISSEDEILMYSPIKESDPPEVKVKKSEYFDAQARLHAEGFSSESELRTSDPKKVDPSNRSRLDLSTFLMFRPLTDSDFKPFCLTILLLLPNTTGIYR
ncbi:hypothetical protein L1887_17877 [Cichorium endivia]|nr:hypothetical protein L1887_17877 [Cichorium endivia]